MPTKDDPQSKAQEQQLRRKSRRPQQQQQQKQKHNLAPGAEISFPIPSPDGVNVAPLPPPLPVPGPAVAASSQSTVRRSHNNAGNNSSSSRRPPGMSEEHQERISIGRSGSTNTKRSRAQSKKSKDGHRSRPRSSSQASAQTKQSQQQQQQQQDRKRKSKRASDSSSKSRKSANSATGTRQGESSSLAAAVTAVSSASDGELARRQSRLEEMQKRSEARLFETQIKDEEKRIRRLRTQSTAATSTGTTSDSSPSSSVGSLQQIQVQHNNQSNQNQNRQQQNQSGAKSTTRASDVSTSSSSGRNRTRNIGDTGNGQQQRRSRRGSANSNGQMSASLNLNPTISSGSRGADKMCSSDEALARALQVEMQHEQDAIRAMEQQFQDEEMARSLAAAEAARMASLGLPPSDYRGGAPSQRRRHQCSFCGTVHKMISFAIVTGCVGVILFVMFGIVFRTAGGDVNSLPPWFRDSWGGSGWEGDYSGNSTAGDFQRWKIKKGSGLRLTLINALTDDWLSHFEEAITDWNGGSPRALELSVVMNTEAPPCEKHSRGKVKVCNGDYGQTDWTGLNELLFENGFIVSSVAMMNENYLRNARYVERQYVMCHELGHAWGLGHRDEIVGNKDLGTCMDYTYTPANNLKPDSIDFQNLANLYGIVPETRRNSLRDLAMNSTISTSPSNMTPEVHVETGAPVVGFLRNDNDSGMKRRRLLFKSDHRETWLTKWGASSYAVTTYLKTKQH